MSAKIIKFGIIYQNITTKELVMANFSIDTDHQFDIPFGNEIAILTLLKDHVQEELDKYEVFSKHSTLAFLNRNK